MDLLHLSAIRETYMSVCMRSITKYSQLQKLCQITVPVDRSLGDYKEAMQAAVREIAAVKMIDMQKLVEMLAAEKKGE